MSSLSKSQIRKFKVGDMLPTPNLREFVLAKAPSGSYIGEKDKHGVIRHATVRFVRTD